MKKKNLLKIATIISENLSKKKSKPTEKAAILSKSPKKYIGMDEMMEKDDDSYKWNAENHEVSKKIRNVVKRMLDYKNRISIDMRPEVIRISSESIKELKKATKMSSHSNQSMGMGDFGDSFIIKIFKDKGFQATFDDAGSCYFFDKTLYSEIEPLVRESYNKSNVENFDILYHQFLRDSGLLRDSNLDNLLVD